MFNLEHSIKQWLRLFNKHRAFDQGKVREMELHLRDHIDDLTNEGYSEQKAFDLAVKEFGEIPKMAKEEFWNIKTKTTLMSILHTRLLNNYFKTSIRTLLKNPLTSFINVFGLSVAIGICVVVYTYLVWDHSMDQFHKNKHEVYLATYFVDRDGAMEQYGLSPTPLAKVLQEDFTKIEKVCRIEDRNVVLKYKDKVFHEEVRYVDASFLEMFTFPLKWGLPSTLEGMSNIILSEKMAVKYFGDDNPIGRDILMKFNGEEGKTFTITGVAEAFPKAHIIEFDFLINFENFRISEPNYDLNDWSRVVNATLIQVNDPSDLIPIAEGMDKYKALQNQVQNDWPIASFGFEQLADLHFVSEDIRNDISYDDDVGRIGMPILGIFMLMLACFNYINIAIVSAAKRLKEIGLRKVIGANRRQVIVQFLAENILLTLFALFLGFTLGVTVFLPWFIELSGWDMELNLLDKNLWIFLFSTLLFTGIASGIYPAFYISKFDIINIFKGSVQFGKKNPLTKFFLGIQLILACITITSGVVFTQNTTYQGARSWGYDKSHSLYTPIADQQAFEQLQAVMVQEPGVLSVSGSNHHLGSSSANTVVSRPDRQYEVRELAVEANYFETMGLQLRDGRTFKPHHVSDKQSIIVNEMLVKKLDLVDPVGEVLKIDSVRYEVIGVVEDFHFYNFFYDIRPVIFTVADQKDFKYLTVKVRDGTQEDTYGLLQNHWATLFPEIPFQGGHQEDIWGDYFGRISSAERFNRVVAIIAVLLASLGLYGLVTLNVSGRAREFSIRKALGAQIQNIASIIVKQYLILTVIAIIVGAPISYFFVDAYLKMLFAYPMPMSSVWVLISVVLLVVVLLTVVLTQVRKVLKSNPVDGLRVE